MTRNALGLFEDPVLLLLLLPLAFLSASKLALSTGDERLKDGNKLQRHFTSHAGVLCTVVTRTTTKQHSEESACADFFKEPTCYYSCQPFAVHQ